MTWSKGFFRLWFVLTLCWVLICAAVIFWSTDIPGKFRTATTPAKYEVKLSTDKVYTFDASMDQSPLYVTIRDAFRSDIQLLRAGGQVAKAQELESKIEENSRNFLSELSQLSADRMSKAQQELRYQALLALGIALGPPAVLLFLGVIIGWIARGFRSNSEV